MLSPNETKLRTQLWENEDGELVLEFPEELLEAMGWGEGTVLEVDAIAGRIILRESRERECASEGATETHQS